MKIVIIGAGKIGKVLCKRLSADGYDVVVIDQSESVLEKLVLDADVRGVVGMGQLAAVQREAGAHKADLVIAATLNDEVNILSCLISKSLGARHTIARVRDPELRAQSDFMQGTFGIDHMINPEYSTATAISRLIRYPAAMHVDYSDSARLDIVSHTLSEDSPLVGLTLREAIMTVKVKMLICAVRQGDNVIIPNGNYILNAFDTLFVVGKYQSIDAFMKKCGSNVKRIRSAVIVGAGRISRYLAESLDESGISVTIIEQDEETCEKLSEEIDFATIIKGSGISSQLLNETRANEADALISLTGQDETNIMIAACAKNLGVGKTIAKINDDSLLEIFETMDIGVAVSQKAVVGQEITEYVRSISKHDDSILSSFDIFGDAVHVIAFKVDDEISKVPLRKMKLKSDLIIASVIKNNVTILPDGDTVLENNDTVLVITTLNNLKKFEDILE